MKNISTKYLWGVLRITLGWVFFWAFIDKLFGLGFATKPDKSWLVGGSPTSGFLTMGTKGPFAEFYQSLAGNPVVDWLFMLGLFAIGAAMLLGIGMKLAAISGALLLLMMYTAGFLPPQNNPAIDDHIIYAVLLLGLASAKAGRSLGLGNWWANTSLVKRYPILE